VPPAPNAATDLPLVTFMLQPSAEAVDELAAATSRDVAAAATASLPQQQLQKEAAPAAPKNAALVPQVDGADGSGEFSAAALPHIMCCSHLGGE